MFGEICRCICGFVGGGEWLREDDFGEATDGRPEPL